MTAASESKHSPLPWRVEMEFGDTVLDRDGKHIATCFCEDEKSPHTIDCANAALIVEAVNEREKLRDAALYTLNLLMLRGDGKTHCVMTWDEFNGAALKLRAALGVEADNGQE